MTSELAYLRRGVMLLIEVEKQYVTRDDTGIASAAIPLLRQVDRVVEGSDRHVVHVDDDSHLHGLLNQVLPQGCETRWVMAAGAKKRVTGEISNTEPQKPF